jgi:hypothetical protein
MNLRLALPVLVVLAGLGIGLALGRWGAGGDADLLALAAEVQRGEQLAPRAEARWRRDGAKWALAAEAVAGGIPLREAAGRFRRLDEAELAGLPGVPGPPGDEEFYGKQMLDLGSVILRHQQRYVATARWYGEGFTAYPQILVDPPTGHRYAAARAAALAGCGQGRDATDLDSKSRAGFRRQALGWLRSALEARRRLLEQEPEPNRWVVACDLPYWLGDPDFDGVRGPDALGRLPAAERQAWQTLWADVADTLARAEGTTAPGKKASR